VLGCALAGFVAWKKTRFVRSKTAREWLQKGAKVIDVRNETEFQERHLPGAINIPLGQLREAISRHAPNKDQGLLLHCLGGVRSGMGRGMLKQLGYRNVFNLGSYSRAEKIISK
jgi:phage shock protein E